MKGEITKREPKTGKGEEERQRGGQGKVLKRNERRKLTQKESKSQTKEKIKGWKR